MARCQSCRELMRSTLLIWGFVVLLIATANAIEPRCRLIGASGAQSNQGYPPRPFHLGFCNEYSRSTCCTQADDETVLRRAAPLYATGSFEKNCILKTRTMMCSVCDAAIGTGRTTHICKSLCDSWYSSCRNDFFAQGSIANQLALCTAESIVCSKLKDFVADGTELCKKFGFPNVSPTNERCFNGKPSFIASKISKPSKTASRFWRKIKTARRQLMAGGTIVLTLVAVLLTYMCRRPAISYDTMTVEERRLLFTQKWAERTKRDDDEQMDIDIDRTDELDSTSNFPATPDPTSPDDHEPGSIVKL